jgi:hypothetical protein
VRTGTITTLIFAAAFSGSAQAAGPGTPLQLSPGNAGTASALSARIPSNWKLRVSQPDALTGQVQRQVITLAKVNPVINGKSATTGLIMQCTTDIGGKKSPTPRLVIVLLSLTGVGHFKNFSARYRFDEGPVHQFVAQSTVGKDHARVIALPEALKIPSTPQLAKLPGLENEVDPGVEIAGAARLRVEFNFLSAGVTFLDFNVAGATQAINTLGCQ